MIITISGLPGSGTTTVGEMLAEDTNFQFTSAGYIFRETAREYGLTLETFSKISESNPRFDNELDKKQISLMVQADNLVLEGRLSAHLTSRAAAGFHSKKRFLKVLLTANAETRAARISQREPDEELCTIIEKMAAREESEKTRYKKYYGIDIADTSVYDIIIPTENKTPREIVDIIRSVAGQELVVSHVEKAEAV